MEEALAVLARGGSVIHATETCYGIACDLTNPGAVERLFGMKERPLNLPVSALFASVEQAKQYVQWPAEAQAFAERFMPGPLTIVLPLRSTASHRLYPLPTENGDPREIQDSELSARGSRLAARTLGVRVSEHPVARALAERFGRPISTTSANVHGQPNPYSCGDIALQFEARPLQPDLVLDSGALPRIPASTVIEIIGGKLKVLRAGSTVLPDTDSSAP